MKITVVLLIVIFVFALIILNKDTSQSEERNFEIQGRKLTVEIADTTAKRARGLMYRKELGKNKGMLFIFPNSAKHSFWMANTKIPLDIIWMDENYNVVHVEKNVPPCSSKNIILCPQYTPKTSAKYVLEVNAGWWN